MIKKASYHLMPRRGRPIEELIARLMNVRNEAQLLHWRTRSYAQHKASDDFLETIQKKLDEFAEVLQGMLARRLDFTLLTRPVVFTYKNMTKVSFLRSLAVLQEKLGSMERVYALDLPPASTESLQGLLNIRDEMLGEIHQTRYLLSFV